MPDHNFNLYYFDQVDSGHFGGSLAIHVGYISPINIGDTLTFDAIYDFDYTKIGIPEFNSTITIEWNLHDGTNIGNTDSFTWQPVDPGYYYVQCIVTVTDNTDSNNTFTISEVQDWQVTSSQENVYMFTLNWKQELYPYQYNNMDIHRFLSNFPIWSSAHQNFFSNTSKLISPIFENISLSIDEWDQFVEANQTIDDEMPFGYRNKDYHMYISRVPRVIKTEYGYGFYAGQAGQMSVESLPIQAVNLLDAYPHSLKEYDSTLVHPSNLIFDFETPIFIQSDRASLITPREFVIVGLNSKGEQVTETVNLISRLPIETYNKFLIIYRIHSEEVDFKITNYLNLENFHSYESQVLVAKRIANTRGEYFEPQFYIDSNTLRIMNGNEVSGREEFTFELGNTPERLFVNNLLDLIYLSNNKIYAGKLMLDYYQIESLPSTTNNNEFIFVDDTNTPVGEVFTSTINIDKIVNELGSRNISISLENDEDIFYLQQDGSFDQENRDWISTSGLQSRITFPTTVTNDKPYIVNLVLDNRPEDFVAMSYQNKVIEYEVISDAIDLFYYDKKLWCQLTDLSYKVIDPVRLGFTSSPGQLNFQRDFQQIELLL